MKYHFPHVSGVRVIALVFKTLNKAVATYTFLNASRTFISVGRGILEALLAVNSKPLNADD